MSYWFGKPHTLVLVRARIDLRNPRKRDRLRAKSEAAFAGRALAPSFWPQELKFARPLAKSRLHWAD